MEQTSKKKTRDQLIAELTIDDLPPRLIIEIIAADLAKHIRQQAAKSSPVAELDTTKKKDVRELDRTPEAFAKARELIQITI